MIEYKFSGKPLMELWDESLVYQAVDEMVVGGLN